MGKTSSDNRFIRKSNYDKYKKKYIHNEAINIYKNTSFKLKKSKYPINANPYYIYQVSFHILFSSYKNLLIENEVIKKHYEEQQKLTEYYKTN